jgi:hypothetical protein
MNLIPKFLRHDKLEGVPVATPDRDTEFDIEGRDVVAITRIKSDSVIVVKNPTALHGHTNFHINCTIGKHHEFVGRFRDKIGIGQPL